VDSLSFHLVQISPVTSAFALFVFSQGWVAAEKVFANERRLLSIEDELAIAREIQASILPVASPKLGTCGSVRRIVR